jgi:DNA-binding transcriptional regulator YdaS (Cro superfamily)
MRRWLMNRKLKARIIEVYGSQADFSEEIGVNETVVSRVIRGRSKLEPEKQVVWAKALKCSRKDIFDNLAK